MAQTAFENTMNSIEETIESLQRHLDYLSTIHGRYCAVIIASPDGAPIEIIGCHEFSMSES